MSQPLAPIFRFSRLATALRDAFLLGLIGFLASCAGTPQTSPRLPVSQEQAAYRAHAKSYYAPPGPQSDPWGPYITEAANRFDVPATWIRAVIMRESGGHLFDNGGNLITSAPGAMGLMQLMPPTYDDLRQQYNLGNDPYDPHDNILAGTAYIRQMYDIYGTPGFLAAYNDGPGSVDNYLRHGRTLPRETRRYVAAIGPQIAGIWPRNRSAADLLVTRHDPAAQVAVPQDTTFGRVAQTTTVRNDVQLAWQHKSGSQATAPAPVAPAAYSPAPGVTGQNNAASISAAWRARGFATAPPPAAVRNPPQSDDDAETEDESPVTPRELPVGRRLRAQPITTYMHRIGSHHHSEGGDWAVQVGAFSNPRQAQAAASRVHKSLASVPSSAKTQVAAIRTRHANLYRARLTGLSHKEAVTACHRLSQKGACIVVPPSGSAF